MKQWYISLLTLIILSKFSGVIQKRAVSECNLDSKILTVLPFIFASILLCGYIFITDRKSIEGLKNPENKKYIKQIFVSSFLGILTSLIYTDLLKTQPYSTISLSRGAIGSIFTLIITNMYLNEKIDQKHWSCRLPIIDARVKFHHAPCLQMPEKVIASAKDKLQKSL